MSIPGIQRLTLRDQAITALRDAIVSGRLSPGSHVSEVDTAAQLGISRGTLREAMLTLQNEGLLTSGPRGRLAVRHMSDQELRDLFDVRAALEALAARTLAGSATREQAVAALRVELESMEGAAVDDLDRRMAADMNFHRRLCALTDNDVLLRAWSSLESSILMSITNAGIDRAVHNMNVQRHLDIVEAIASGDQERAASSVRSHMDEAASVLLG